MLRTDFPGFESLEGCPVFTQSCLQQALAYPEPSEAKLRCTPQWGELGQRHTPGSRELANWSVTQSHSVDVLRLSPQLFSSG